MVTDVILPIALFLMMSGMGLSLEIIDFRRILEYPKAAIIGIASMLILIPALGFAIATCASLSPEMAVGLILVATCPGGMFSNLLTHFGKANLALSVGMTAFVSSIYVFSIPFWTRFALEQFAAESTHVAPPIEKTIVPLFLFVLVVDLIVTRLDNCCLVNFIIVDVADGGIALVFLAIHRMMMEDLFSM